MQYVIELRHEDGHIKLVYFPLWNMNMKHLNLTNAYNKI